MDKEIFLKRLEGLGSLKRKKGGYYKEDGYEDLVFIPTPRPAACPEEHLDKIFEIKWKSDGSAKWKTKCKHCGEVWRGLFL